MPTDGVRIVVDLRGVDEVRAQPLVRELAALALEGSWSKRAERVQLAISDEDNEGLSRRIEGAGARLASRWGHRHFTPLEAARAKLFAITTRGLALGYDAIWRDAGEVTLNSACAPCGGSEERDELLHAQVGVAEDCPQSAPLQVATMHRDADTPRGRSRMLEDEMASGLVVGQEPDSLQRRDDLSGSDDGHARHRSSAAGEKDLDSLVSRGLRDVGRQRLAVLEKALAVGADGVGNHAASLLERVALGHAARERRHVDGESTLRLGLEDGGVGEVPHRGRDRTCRFTGDRGEEPAHALRAVVATRTASSCQLDREYAGICISGHK
jgi:hypothetical protein